MPTAHGPARARRAFIALVEILVDADRTADLRAMAQTGDDRAHVTLIELLRDRGHKDELRREADTGNGLALHALVDLLLTQERASDAVALCPNDGTDDKETAMKVRGG